MRNNYFVHIDSIFQELFKQAGIRGRITKCDVDIGMERVQMSGDNDVAEYVGGRNRTTLKIEADVDGLPQKMFEPKPRVYELIDIKNYSIKDIESIVNMFALGLDKENSKLLRSDLNNWKKSALTNRDE